MTKGKNTSLVDFDILNSLNVGMTIVDNNLDIIVANKKVVELLGLPDVLVMQGENIIGIISFLANRGDYGFGKVEDLIEERLNLFKQKKPYQYIRKGPNNTFIEMEGNVTTTGGVATTYTDVTKTETARIAAEQENVELVEQILEKNNSLQEEKQKSVQETAIKDIILASTPHGVTFFDRDLKLLACNECFMELMNFPKEMCSPGTHMAELFRYNASRGEYGEVDIETAVAERIELAGKFEPHSFQRPTTEGRIVEVNGVQVPMGFVTTYSDVTNIVNARQESEELNKKWKEITDSSPVGMGIIRLDDSNFQQINNTAATLFGFDKPEDAIGTSARSLWLSETQREACIANFLRDGFIVSEEIQMQNILGEPFYCYLSWNPVRHEGYDCIVFWIYDITNKKSAQKHLYESEKMASLGRLVAGVAHEINTPIGIGVTATSHLVEEVEACNNDLATGKLSKRKLEKLFEISTESLNIVLRNLQTAATLVQNFKLVSVDQVSEEVREIQVSHYIEQVLSSLNPKIKKANVTVNLRCLEDCYLNTYPGAVSQILTNLVTNAISHGFDGIEDGIIDVNVSGHEGKVVEIRFQDNGVGIPEEVLGKVMDPFFTTKRGKGGSGLGLSIVHNIVTQSLKGSISIKSVLGEGTMVYITLPALKVEEGNK